MTKAKALLFGGLTVWPIIYIFLFFVVVLLQIFMMSLATQAPPEEIPLFFKIIFPLHFLTMIWIVSLIAFYIWHIFRTDLVPQDKKALWAVVIFLGNVLAMPVYWYLYIWKKTA